MQSVPSIKVRGRLWRFRKKLSAYLPPTCFRYSGGGGGGAVIKGLCTYSDEYGNMLKVCKPSVH